MAKEQSIPEVPAKVAGKRHVTPESFASLLTALGDNPGEGTNYEQLRSKLIFFFSRRLLLFPEDLADEVLDRLAFRLSQGIEITSVEAFALGIARHVAQEQINERSRLQTVDNTFFDNIPTHSVTHSKEEEILHMERCLKKLTSSEARLLRGYYLSIPTNPIRARKQLAEDLGISAISLRQRVFLARQRLRLCMMMPDRKRGNRS
jgi:DNA-directed RNA polymerase specialized sigma24 family protein